MATKTRTCRYQVGQTVEVYTTVFTPIRPGSKFMRAVDQWVRGEVFETRVADETKGIWGVGVMLNGQHYQTLVGPRGGNNTIRPVQH